MDVAIKNAKARAKPYKMGNAFGLFLLVQPSGGKLWRFKYRVEGREKKLAIGTYPTIGLDEARRRRDEDRELLAVGKDPPRERQREKVPLRFRQGTPSPLSPRNSAETEARWPEGLGCQHGCQK